MEPLRKRRLKTSVFFLFLSDISGLFATFLPMKSVFILAASDVPRFFPTVLVEGGPTVAALALVAAAVVFAFVAWVSKKLVLALEVAYLRAQQPGTLLPGAKHSPTVKAPQRAVGDSHLLVAFITGAGIGIISWLFVSGLLAWLAVSFLVVMVKSSRAPLRAPYTSAVDRAVHMLRQWIQSSALWITVVIALFVLLVSVPLMGITGILLSAVLGRRFLMAVADSSVELNKRSAVAKTRKETGRDVADDASRVFDVAVKFPVDYLGTGVGRRNLREFLRIRGFLPDDFVLIGRPNRESLTLLAHEERWGTQVLFRVFAQHLEHKRDAELHFRQMEDPVPIYGLRSAAETVVAGLPGIEIGPLNGDITVNWRAGVKPPQVISWQLEMENRCLESRALQDTARKVKFPAINQDLVNSLTKLARLPGVHQSVCVKLLRIHHNLDDLLTAGPRVWVPPRPLAPHDFITLSNGMIEPLSTLAWEIGRIGDGWGNPKQFSTAFYEIQESQQRFLSFEGPRSVLRARVKALARAANGYHLEGVNTEGKEILSLLAGRSRAEDDRTTTQSSSAHT